MKPKPASARFGRWGAGVSRPIGTLLVDSVAAETGRRSFSIFRITMKPRASHPAIWHARTSEFFLVTRGALLAVINGRPRRMRKGDGAHLAPGAVHEFRAGPSGCEVMSVFVPALNLRKPDIRR
jgi:quercetin dioxygenase-like cupin family protein